MTDKTFHILTFGCQMNVRDSQWLASILKSRGFSEADMSAADAIIINTCSVRAKPEQKVMSAIKNIQSATKNNPRVLVCVMGCVASQLGEELYNFSPQTRLVAGSDETGKIPEAIEFLLENINERRALLAASSFYPEREPDALTEPLAGAFVSIMQGCDNFCSYCIVPYARGPQKSRSSEAVLRECAQRLSEGAREITLLGQNVNSWGMDNSTERFPRLLRIIAALPGLERLRFVTPHPKDIDPDTIAAFGETPVLCPKIHLPLQSGSNRILKAMKRGYAVEDYLKIIDALKKARPDMAFATDLIVGFPGETEADFQETLDAVEACGFISSFSFCYSERPGTAAASLPGKLEAEIKLERLARLQEAQEKITARWLAKRIGEQTEILIEGPSAKNFGWQGRDPYGVVVNIDQAVSANPIGKILSVAISEVKKHTLKGTI